VFFGSEYAVLRLTFVIDTNGGFVFGTKGTNMTWTVDTTELDLISQAGEPPQDPNLMLQDQKWSAIFHLWAKNKVAAGDQQPMCLYQLESCLVQTLTLDEYYPLFFDDGAQYPIQMPVGLKIKAKMVVEDRSDDSEDTVKKELKDNVVEQLWRYYGDFFKDVKAKQQEAVSKVDDAAPSVPQPVKTTVSTPKVVPLTRARIDQVVVDKTNEVALKDLQPDSQPITFLMFDDLLLIGDNHPEAYVEFAKKNGGNKGRLAMKSKGGAFSTGEILVQRVSGVDEAKLKAAIKRFSQKKVTFQDVIPDII
jgi:hypothetical protein